MLNPILRYFGFFIGSIIINNDVIGLKFCKGQKLNKIKYSLNCNDYDSIIKRRTIY